MDRLTIAGGVPCNYIPLGPGNPSRKNGEGGNGAKDSTDVPSLKIHELIALGWKYNEEYIGAETSRGNDEERTQLGRFSRGEFRNGMNYWRMTVISNFVIGNISELYKSCRPCVGM
jgi:hypothetical protein